MWDAPNMDRCLAEVVGRSASPDIRPRMDALVTWFSARAASSDRVEAAVFATVPPGAEAPLARWVANLRQFGWAVFVKPRRRRGDDIADELLRHVERAFRQGNLVELVLASHDGRAFAGSLRRYVAAGVAVTVLGYRERLPEEFGAHGPAGDTPAGDRPGSDTPDFMDLELIPGVFPGALPRTNLFDLPAGGRWFPPLQEPGAGTAAAGDREPHRADVVRFVRQALDERGPDGMTLHEAGERLRDRFPGFTLENSGYGSVTELVEDLRAGGEVQLVRSDHGHVLQPVAAGDETVIDLTDTVIDLTDLTDLAEDADEVLAGDDPADRAGDDGPDRPATDPAAPGAVSPIYRLFGFGTDGPGRVRSAELDG